MDEAKQSDAMAKLHDRHSNLATTLDQLSGERAEGEILTAYSILRCKIDRTRNAADKAYNGARSSKGTQMFTEKLIVAKNACTELERSLDVFRVSWDLLGEILTELAEFSSYFELAHGRHGTVDRFKSTYNLARDLIKVVVNFLDGLRQAAVEMFVAYSKIENVIIYKLKDVASFSKELIPVTDFRNNCGNMIVSGFENEPGDPKDMHKLHKLLFGEREKLKKAGLVQGIDWPGLISKLRNHRYIRDLGHSKTVTNCDKISKLKARVKQKAESDRSCEPGALEAEWREVRDLENGI